MSLESRGSPYTPDGTHLFPSLTRQDRHPSAPLLHTMLTSGLSNETTPTHAHAGGNLLSPIDSTRDMLLDGGGGVELDSIGQRVRSASMPSRAPRLPPQISISSPDDIFCESHLYMYPLSSLSLPSSLSPPLSHSSFPHLSLSSSLFFLTFSPSHPPTLSSYFLCVCLVYILSV